MSRRDLKFKLGDHVFLKVALMREVLRFGKKGKLSPKFIYPFKILERFRSVVYRPTTKPRRCAHCVPLVHIAKVHARPYPCGKA